MVLFKNLFLFIYYRLLSVLFLKKTTCIFSSIYFAQMSKIF